MTLPAEGWHHYLSEPPPAGVLLEWGRFTTGWEWRAISYNRGAIYLSYDHLYWRWTGIGREEWAQRRPAERMRHKQEDSLHCGGGN